ncbi:MAG TPA: hypothetical protein VN982_10165 [Candidatus Dormibacteraeota bacterium]|nr:hypothetical protein [Candidatus Dormibacteraeota bacterium]
MADSTMNLATNDKAARVIVLVILMSSLFVLGPRAGDATQRASSEKGLAKNVSGVHYLLLVNTALAPQMTAAKFAEFDRSPYDGIAVAFWHAYDTAPAPSAEQIESKIAEWKKSTNKDIWPWVYLNRMIGVDAEEHNSYTEQAYFHQFAGADLDDKAGALSDYLLHWKNNLRAAKNSKQPGIVCDLEFYNYRKEYDIAVLAEQTGKKPREVADILRQLGKRMADTAAAEYPDAKIWFLFTGLSYKDYYKVVDDQHYPSPAYIVMGLLDEIQSRHFSLKVLSGGESSLGYCHESLAQFQEIIEKRASKFVPHLQKYGDSLELAGTMTLWNEASGKTGWVKEGACASAGAKNAEELQPYLELILKTFRYNWIYGSSDGSYYAFDPQSAGRFNQVISKAQASGAVKH